MASPLRSRINERIAIPAPRSSIILPPIDSDDGLWACTITLQVQELSSVQNELRLSCCLTDLKCPASTRRILWGGGVSYIELNAMEWENNHGLDFDNYDTINANLKIYSRFLNTPYEFLSIHINRSFPNELELNIHLFVEGSAPPAPKLSLPKNAACLSKSLLSLLDSGILSDVKLCAEGQEIAAHRNILAARSEYFKTKFKPEWMESKVHVDMSLPILSEMLRYMYTGNLGDDVDWVKLLIAADMYLVTDLCEEIKERIEKSLLSDKPAASVIDLLETSVMFNSPSLRSTALKYMKEHSEVFKTEGWREFKTEKRQMAADAVLDMYDLPN